MAGDREIPDFLAQVAIGGSVPSAFVVIDFIRVHAPRRGLLPGRRKIGHFERFTLVHRPNEAPEEVRIRLPDAVELESDLRHTVRDWHIQGAPDLFQRCPHRWGERTTAITPQGWLGHQ